MTPTPAASARTRSDTDALYAFVSDRLTERREVADVRTSVVYEHIRRPVLEPLGSDTRT